MLRSVGEAVAFSILLTVQAKMQQLLGNSGENRSVSAFEAAIMDSWIALSSIELHCYIVQPFSGKVLKTFLLAPSG
jgi:hypothetical protein